MFLVLLGFLSIVALRSIDMSFGTNQLIFFVGAGLGYLFVSSIPFPWLARSRWMWYLGCVGLLLFTLILGRATNGAVSWIHIGSFRLQPSEFLKPALMLVLAGEVLQAPLTTWWNMLRFWGVAAIPLGLVLLQPDFGTALVTIFGVGCIFLAGKPPLKFVIPMMGLAVVTVVFAWFFLFKPYQKDRILTFFSPTSDPLGRGYNAQQALVAVGSGGMWGKGFGNGLQSHLRFLPERQTDFLYASFSEEAGFVGSASLVTIYAALFVSIAWYIRRSDDQLKILFTLGVLGVLFIQTTINIGMNIGLLPITGVTLPLFSLGGSSVAATVLTLALLESARRSTYHVPRNIT